MPAKVRLLPAAPGGVAFARTPSWGGVAGNAMTARAQGAFMTHLVTGSTATCAERMEHFLTHCALDGLMLIFADYKEGLRVAGREILPRLRKTA